MPHTTEDPELGGKNNYEYCDEIPPGCYPATDGNGQVFWADGKTGKLYKQNPKKDPRDTLIEAQREYIELLGDLADQREIRYESKADLAHENELKTRIQAAEKAIKGG